MAWATGAKREAPSGHKRFFGPGYYAFRQINHLDAVPQSAECINFYRGIYLAGTEAGVTVKDSPVIFGGADNGNYIKWGTGANGSGPLNQGHVITYDDQDYDHPFMIGKGGIGDGGTAAGLNLEGAVKGSGYVYLPNPNDYTVYHRDFGRSPAQDAFDNHAFFISRNGTAYGIIVISVNGYAVRLANASLNAFLSRFRDGRFDYRTALAKLDVEAFLDPSTYAVNGFTRFENENPGISYDSPYGRKGWNWNTTSSNDTAFLFGFINGGGVAEIDQVATYEEFARGHIKHQMLCYVWDGGFRGSELHNHTASDRGYSWPAQRSDGVWVDDDVNDVWWNPTTGDSSGTNDGPGYYKVRIPQYGWAVRLKEASYKNALDNLSSTAHVGAPFAKVWLRAMYEYGAVIMDKNTACDVPAVSEPYNLYTGDAEHSHLHQAYRHDSNTWWLSGSGNNVTRAFCFNIRIAYDSRFPAISDTYGTGVQLDRNNGAHVTAAQNENTTFDALQHCVETEAGLSFDDFEFVDLEGSNLFSGDMYDMEVH